MGTRERNVNHGQCHSEKLQDAAITLAVRKLKMCTVRLFTVKSPCGVKDKDLALMTYQHRSRE